jgi:hypothetical protein
MITLERIRVKWRASRQKSAWHTKVSHASLGPVKGRLVHSAARMEFTEDRFLFGQNSKRGICSTQTDLLQHDGEAVSVYKS